MPLWSVRGVVMGGSGVLPLLIGVVVVPAEMILKKGTNEILYKATMTSNSKQLQPCVNHFLVECSF